MLNREQSANRIQNGWHHGVQQQVPADAAASDIVADPMGLLMTAQMEQFVHALLVLFLLLLLQVAKPLYC